MENENFIEKLASNLGQNVSVKTVFGEPIQSGEKTIVPVARIAYGFGGGYGQGKKKRKGTTEEATSPEEEPVGKGAGGGGFKACAKGVYEITPTCTRFIPANSAEKIFLGIAIGYFLKKFFFSKKKK